MKKISISLLLAAGVLASCVNKQKAQSEQPVTDSVTVQSEIVVDTLLRFNESTLPYNGGILVANFGASELNPLNNEGKGYIVYYKDGKMMPFIAADGSMSAPKGMFEKDGYLYVADVNKVHIFKLGGDVVAAPKTLNLPEGELFVNDLAADGNTLYVSVTNTGNIYKMDITNPDALTNKSLTLFVNVVGANGLLVDGGKLFVASYPADGKTTEANVIYVINDLQNPVPEAFISTAGQYDGLALSNDKKTLYVTNWTPVEVEAIDMETKTITPIALETSLAGLADLSLVDDTLYIPDLGASKLIVKKLR